MTSTENIARKIRIETLRMVAAANASHIGGALSMADLLAVLYGKILNHRPDDPNWCDRDRVILSKGHCCSALYATLAIHGYFSVDVLTTYGKDGSRLMAHVSHKVPGVEFSTGSLGHGLPVGCGKALAAKRKGENWRVVVILSDGELDEGSNWESILFAPHHGLDNLMVVVDHNAIQSLGDVDEVLDLAPLADKFRSFRWAVREVNGHSHEELTAALLDPLWCHGRPSALIAHTIKGKGVDYMEGKLEWHYRSPTAPDLDKALSQLQQPP